MSFGIELRLPDGTYARISGHDWCWERKRDAVEFAGWRNVKDGRVRIYRISKKDLTQHRRAKQNLKGKRP